MEYILKRVENNLRSYAGSYLGIDSVKYEKGILIISRNDDRFLSLYKKDIGGYEVRGNKIQIFI